MKTWFLLPLLGTLASGPTIAQQKVLTPQTAAQVQFKAVQLDNALSAFRTGALHEGLLLMASVHALDPNDADLKSMYRLNCSRFAMRISEDCDMEGTFANCDTAIKYIEIARRLGDSSVYHEVRADALYQKVLALEQKDVTAHQDQMPSRSLTRDMAYRYLPEEKKVFYKELLNQAIYEIASARGDLDKKEKINELTNKLKVIERNLKIVGTR